MNLGLCFLLSLWHKIQKLMKSSIQKIVMLFRPNDITYIRNYELPFNIPMNGYCRLESSICSNGHIKKNVQ